MTSVEGGGRDSGRLLCVEEGLEEDEENLFCLEEILDGETMSEIEKQRYSSILRNYLQMKKLGLEPSLPPFVREHLARKKRKEEAKKNKRSSKKEENEDWTPAFEDKGKKRPYRRPSSSTLGTSYRSPEDDDMIIPSGMKDKLCSQPSTSSSGVIIQGRSCCLKESSSSSPSSSNVVLSPGRRLAVKMGPCRPMDDHGVSMEEEDVTSSSHQDASLSANQEDVVHFWNTATLVVVGKDLVKVVPTTLKPSVEEAESNLYQDLPLQSSDSGQENVTPNVRRNPRRRFSRAVKSYYCEDCGEKNEGECPIHPVYLILDTPVLRDGTVEDRAKKTAPWPLSICPSKVKGAGLGVWTNADLPAHLVFGPYEGHFLPHVEEGKESGYGWRVQWMGGPSPGDGCIDAKDQSVSNWMRFVNGGSRNERETNIAAFQYKGQIYYKTLKEIQQGTELMVWYRDDYGRELGLSKDDAQWKDPPAKDDLDDRQCAWCGRLYSSCQYLLRHLKFCRKKQINKERQDERRHESLKDSFEQSQTFECSDCGKRFNQPAHLKTHMRIHTGEQPFECAECGKRVNDQTNLKRHMCIHTGEQPFECAECGIRFNRHINLETHMRIHTGEQPFECAECAKRFNDQNNLKRHMRIHTGEQPFGCAVCDKRFNRRFILKAHMRMHTGEQPFECAECDKRFNDHNNLKKHMRIHTGEKPFECAECGKRVNDQTNLKRHMRIHTGEQPFECAECGIRFNRHINLETHMRIHTGE